MCLDKCHLRLQCGRRALTTSNAQCVCAVLGQLNNLLTTALYPQLHAKVEVSWVLSPVCRLTPIVLGKCLSNLQPRALLVPRPTDTTMRAWSGSGVEVCWPAKADLYGNEASKWGCCSWSRLMSGVFHAECRTEAASC